MPFDKKMAYIAVLEVLENNDGLMSEEEIVEYLVDTFEIEKQKAENLVKTWEAFQTARREIA